jgi:hypothetical protein
VKTPVMLYCIMAGEAICNMAGEDTSHGAQN